MFVEIPSITIVVLNALLLLPLPKKLLLNLTLFVSEHDYEEPDVENFNHAILRIYAAFKGNLEIDKSIVRRLIISVLAEFLVSIIPGPCIFVGDDGTYE